ERHIEAPGLRFCVDEERKIRLGRDDARARAVERGGGERGFVAVLSDEQHGGRLHARENRRPRRSALSGHRERLKAYLRALRRRGEFFLSFASASFARRIASSPIESRRSR